MEHITIIIVSIIFSAFFSGMEIAYVSANKLKVEVDKKSGGLSAKLLGKIVKTDSDFISTMLVGNNLMLVIYGISAALLLEPILKATLPQSLFSEPAILIFQTIITSLVILIFAEFIPKSLFRINPNRIINFFSIPVVIFYYLLFPIVFITIKLASAILKYGFRINIEGRKKVFDIVDIDHFLKEFSSDDKDHSDSESLEMQIFKNAIEFPEVKLRECMIPRTEIVAFEQNDDLISIREKFTETGLSKILIYKEDINEVIGYVHVFDFFKNPEDIKSILRPLLIVPETMLANKLLQSFIQQNKSIAVVVDEFGGTAGLITIEDIMEEIFGEIDDEYDFDNLVEKQIKNNEYLFSARLEIDYLNEKYSLKLPESEEYETLGGLIINYHESIPDKDDVITINDFVFKVTQVTENRIEQVILKTNK